MSQDKGPNQMRNTNGEGGDLQDPQRMASELAKAFQELAKGEQTASALEKKLDGIENRIDELLAAAEAAVAHREGSHEETQHNKEDRS